MELECSDAKRRISGLRYSLSVISQFYASLTQRNANEAILKSDIRRPRLPRIRNNSGPDKVRRVVNRYLVATSWKIEPPWDWANVRIRAKKNGRYLNLAVMDYNIPTWTTTIKDIHQLSIRVNGVVGILSTRPVPRMLKATADEMGLFVISLDELGDVERIVLEAESRDKANRLKALRAGDIKVESFEPHFQPL